MRSRPIAMSAELFDFQPFSCVPPVFLSCVTRNTRGTLGGIGPAFGALKSDYDPDALVFSHKGRSAAVALRNYKVQSYKAECHLCRFADLFVGSGLIQVDQ